MKFYLIVFYCILCFVAATQCNGQCNFVKVIVEEGLAKIDHTFEELKEKNIEPFVDAIANAIAPLVEFNSKLKDIVKEYTNQSCVMESIDTIDASMKKGLKLAEDIYKPENVKKGADTSLGDYNKVIADEIKKQTATLDDYVKEHNINKTCYLEIFREGYRNVSYLFDNVIPDYLNNFAVEIEAKLFETTQKMEYWTNTVNSGVEDCKTKPFTPFCVAALLQDNTPKLVKETDVGGLLADTQLNYANGLEGERTNAIQIIAMTFQKMFNAISKC